MKAEWVKITQAAKAVNVDSSKLSRLVNQGKLKHKKDNRDMRATYVDLNEVRAMFPPVEQEQ